MKFGVIGLGRFGFQVATTLAENGMEVLGVDMSESIVSSIRDFITYAVCIQVANEQTLRSIGMDEMETVVVAMGENFAESILITAILKKKLHIPKVITRAVNDIHKEILMLIGADKVVLPEHEIGQKLADNLSLPFNAITRISKDFSIAQIPVSGKMIGKKVHELSFIKEHHATCLGVKQKETIVPPYEIGALHEKDILIIAGTNKDLARISNG
ncbi:MAG: TrkA family potassium uptake protein [Candidatus Babeliales bacterium]